MADGRRLFVPAVLAGLAGSGLAALSGGKPWAAPDGRAGSTLVDHSGGHVPLAGALGLVALACWGVLLVTRGRVRRGGRRPGRAGRRGAGRDGGPRPVLGARLRTRRDRRPRHRRHLGAHVTGWWWVGPGRLAAGPRSPPWSPCASAGPGPRWAAGTTRRRRGRGPRTSTRSTCGAPSTRATTRRTRPTIRMRLPRSDGSDPGPDHEEQCMSDNHGNTPAAWAAVAVAMLGFVVGGHRADVRPREACRCSGSASASAPSPSWSSSVMARMGLNGPSH